MILIFDNIGCLTFFTLSNHIWIEKWICINENKMHYVYSIISPQQRCTTIIPCFYLSKYLYFHLAKVNQTHQYKDSLCYLTQGLHTRTLEKVLACLHLANKHIVCHLQLSLSSFNLVTNLSDQMQHTNWCCVWPGISQAL